MLSFVKLFERVYVINLAARADRRREMDAQLARIGLRLNESPVELFPAVRPLDSGSFSSIGSRGCFLSHLAVLRKAKAEGLDTILVLEDDVNFTDRFDELSHRVAIRLVAEEWSFFYGGYRVGEAVRGEVDAGFLQFDDEVGTTHFYALRGEVIGALLEYLEEVMHRPAGHVDGGAMHVDGAYCWFRKCYPSFRTLLADPPLGYQRPSRTDVHELRWFDRTPLVRDLTTFLRRRRRT